jgi:hypothetical protein
MTTAEKLREKLLRKAFRMPKAQMLKARKSTITNAFANSLLPPFTPTLDEIEEALRVLGMDPSDVRCVYCGRPSTEWDHLRPIVVGLRPTGYLSEIANLVPACNKCNQSKRNADWREWMLSHADHSPTGRNLIDVAERIARIEAFERWRKPRRVNFRRIIPAEEWENYWKSHDEVVRRTTECQAVADDIRARVIAAMGGAVGKPAPKSRRKSRRS